MAFQSGIQATEHFDANVLTPQSNFFVPTFESSLTSSCATLMQCEAVDTHFDSMRLQSGTILTVEQVEDEFECPECWKHPINNATCFTHCIELAHSIFSFRKIGHLPQGPAESQTGDVTAATRLRIGQRRLITAPQDGKEDSAHTRKHRCPSRYKNRAPREAEN